jgi:hypothetical protein
MYGGEGSLFRLGDARRKGKDRDIRPSVGDGGTA